MTFVGSTNKKITKHKNSKDMPYLEITEVFLVDCNIAKMSINLIRESCVQLLQKNHLDNH